MSNIYLDQAAAAGNVQNIQNQINALQAAANAIDKEMANLTDAWKGASADKAQSVYAEGYKKLITIDIPQKMGEFRTFMDNCVKEIFDTDRQLSGR